MGSHASVVIVVAITFLLLLHRLSLQLESAEDDLFFAARCHPFECGNLNNISHPFSNSQHPECGLSVIHCDEYNRPIIYFGFGGERKRYEVEAIHHNNNTIVIRHFPDGDQDGGVEEAACHWHNFTAPTFSSLATTLLFQVISPNLTLVTCSYNPKYSPPKEIVNQFFEHTYYCPGRGALHVFYQNSDPKQGRSLSYVSKEFCSVFQIPVHNLLPPLSDSVNKADDHLSPLLHAGFSLKWSFPPECHECDVKGVPCRRDPLTSTVECANINNGGNHWKVPVIVTSAAFFLGASLLILFLIYRGHKKRKFAAIRSKDISVSSTPFSRNFSSDPSLTTTDLEKASTYFGVPIFSYDELEEATSNFDSTKELGDGGFGTVYHGKLRDGRVVAVKRLYENNYKRVEQFMNEVEILTRLRHQNLVTLYGCTSRRSRELILVYEYIPNGTVADHLHGDRAKAGGLPWSIRMSIAIETASALSYLHASDIIHRDVKTNNILLDNNFGVKVADFGLSRLFPTDVTHVSTAPQGTPGYVDPEYHQCYQLTDKSDVYSFGVVLIELISSKPAVDITRHRHEINLANMAINKIQNRTLHELIDPCLNFESDHRVRRMATAVAELAFRCLQFEREMRPTMDEVLEVLNGIQSEEDGMVAKTEEADIPSDDVGLLKKGLSPPSPDSVVNYVWESQKTTPNTSS